MMFATIESLDCWPKVSIAVAVNLRISLPKRSLTSMCGCLRLGCGWRLRGVAKQVSLLIKFRPHATPLQSCDLCDRQIESIIDNWNVCWWYSLLHHLYHLSFSASCFFFLSSLVFAHIRKKTSQTYCEASILAAGSEYLLHLLANLASHSHHGFMDLKLGSD